MWSLPDEVEEALWEAARAELPARALEGRQLRPAVLDRSRIYTSERERLAEPPATDADLAARALFFTAADAPKVMVPLAELVRVDLLPASDPLRVVDLGAGVGAMSLGLSAFLRERGDRRRIEVHAVDRDARALRIFERAGRALDIAVDARAENMSQPPAADSADLALIGSALNELTAEQARLAVRAAIAAAPVVILIEPALRHTSRALHELRDWVIGNRVAHVFAPCTRRIAPCPALEDPDDWCHEDRPTRLPPRANQLAQNTGLRTRGLKFSYLTLLREPAEQVAIPPGRVALRVVSQPRKLKGRRELFACGPDGRARVRLLKRHRGDDNRAFEGLRRGDLLVRDDRGTGDGIDDIRAGEAVDRIATTPD